MNNVKELIESKKNVAEKFLKPTFETVWEKAVNMMKESKKLYPTVSVVWTTKFPEKVKLECGDCVEWLPISLDDVHEVSIEDILKYVNDAAETENFKNFSIDTSHPTNTHYGKEVKVLEEGLDVKASLKTLF